MFTNKLVKQDEGRLFFFQIGSNLLYDTSSNGMKVENEMISPVMRIVLLPPEMNDFRPIQLFVNSNPKIEYFLEG